MREFRHHLLHASCLTTGQAMTSHLLMPQSALGCSPHGLHGVATPGVLISVGSPHNSTGTVIDTGRHSARASRPCIRAAGRHPATLTAPSPRDRGRHSDCAPPSPLACSPASICSSADRDPTWFSQETVPSWRRLRRSTHTSMPATKGPRPHLRLTCNATPMVQLYQASGLRSFTEKKCQTCPLGSIPSNMTLAPGGQGTPTRGRQEESAPEQKPQCCRQQRGGSAVAWAGPALHSPRPAREASPWPACSSGLPG